MHYPRGYTRPRPKLAAALFIVVGVVALSLGTVCYWKGSLNLGDGKGDHVFPRPGDQPLGDDEAISIARQVLARDGRDVERLTGWNLESNRPDTRPAVTPGGSENRGVVVHFRHSGTGWWWYVRIDREPGRLVASSSHGL